MSHAWRAGLWGQLLRPGEHLSRCKTNLNPLGGRSFGLTRMRSPLLQSKVLQAFGVIQHVPIQFVVCTAIQVAISGSNRLNTARTGPRLYTVYGAVDGGTFISQIIADTPEAAARATIGTSEFWQQRDPSGALKRLEEGVRDRQLSAVSYGDFDGVSLLSNAGGLIAPFLLCVETGT